MKEETTSIVPSGTVAQLISTSLPLPSLSFAGAKKSQGDLQSRSSNVSTTLSLDPDRHCTMVNIISTALHIMSENTDILSQIRKRLEWLDPL